MTDINELPTAFSTLTRDGFDALNVLAGAQFYAARRQIIGLAATHRLPTMYEAREFVDDGGLISYGPNVADMTRRAATFIVKVLAPNLRRQLIPSNLQKGHSTDKYPKMTAAKALPDVHPAHVLQFRS